MRRFAVVLLGASLVLAVAMSASASQRHGNATPVQKAENCIRAALRQENLAVKYIKEGKVSRGALGQFGAALRDLECATNATRAAGALDEISVAESKAIRKVIRRVEFADNNAIYLPNTRDAIEELSDADELKQTALADLKKATAPPPPPSPPPASAGALTSPGGSGPIKVTNVKCDANGTGGNPERDADFTVNGALWHIEQVYPATYLPGGLATKPMVFIEDKPAPYNQPDIHIYGAFSVTVSGDVGAISSGQQVNVDGGLIDTKGNPVPGHISVTYKCP